MGEEDKNEETDELNDENKSNKVKKNQALTTNTIASTAVIHFPQLPRLVK
jgi:hypothetical protein